MAGLKTLKECGDCGKSNNLINCDACKKIICKNCRVFGDSILSKETMEECGLSGYTCKECHEKSKNNFPKLKIAA